MKPNILSNFKKQSCSTCKNLLPDENGKSTCKFRTKPGGGKICRKYRFDPFAHRIPRPRSVDTTMFDPLDFKID